MPEPTQQHLGQDQRQPDRDQPDQQRQQVAVEVDRDAGAAYFRLSQQPVARTDEHSPTVLVDVSAAGDVVGIEVLGLDPLGVQVPEDLEELESRYSLKSSLRSLLAHLMLAAGEPFALQAAADHSRKR